MDKVCEELDKSKAEIEKLKAEYRSKTELSENLKRAHNEQLVKIQEANSELEKQAQELNEKEEEIYAVKHMYEDVKSSLIEKESIIRHLVAANDKSRGEFVDKCQKLEEQNKKLVFALDEANEKNVDQDQKMNVLRVEIEGLNRRLSISQSKCLEAEKRVKLSKELSERDDVLLKLEEDNRKFGDKLKWRNEQFKHLEEAHKKLRDEFRATKVGLEREKLTLVDEICSLRTNLDSQVRISEDLEKRLKMCNEALAHEESRRKYLEVEVLEYKTRFDNVLTEYQDAKSHFECLTDQSEKQISALRHSLGTKETFYREAEYRAERLEQENRELLTSLKELQEAQIQKAGCNSSLPKPRNKLRSVEQIHTECSAKLKAKEIEWSSELEKITADVNNHKSEIQVKDVAIKKLENQLEDCRFLTMQLRFQNEESDAMMLLVLKSGISEAQSKLVDVDDMNRKLEEVRTLKLLFDNVEEEKQLLQKEVENYKKLLEESSKSRLRLEEKALQIESDANQKLEKVHDDLDMENSRLIEIISEQYEIEFELCIWKTISQRLKCELEESQDLHKNLEASLLAQMDNGELPRRKKADLFNQLEKKDSIISNLQQQIVSLEQESFRREFEGAVLTGMWSEGKFEHERQNLVQLVEKKDRIIDDLLQRVSLLEQKFNYFSSQIAEKQVEINLVREAWEKIAAAKILADLDIEETKLMITELENDICEIQNKLKLQEESLSVKLLEIKTLTEEMGTKLRISDSLNYELNNEKKNLVEDITTLSSERETLLSFMDGLGDEISEISDEDTLLMGTLGKILQSFNSDVLFVSAKENVNSYSSPTSKSSEVSLKRSPFKQACYRHQNRGLMKILCSRRGHSRQWFASRVGKRGIAMHGSRFVKSAGMSFTRSIKRLGVQLEEKGESFYNPFIQKVIDKLDKKGLVEESQGARVISVDGVDRPLIIVKSDGGFNYASIDLTALWCVCILNLVLPAIVYTIWFLK